MQYALQVFEYEQNRKFRIIDRDGEPWFVLTDVCRELELTNPSMAAAGLDDDERDTLSNVEGIADSRAQSINIINESGLYSLILRSRKDAAKRLKKWVTAEVLPSIRRTGGYRIGGKTPAFIRRYNENWHRVSAGHFSVLSEVVIRVWGRLEQLGHVMADRSKDGTENRPDNSVGALFSRWLHQNHPGVAENYSFYSHVINGLEFDVRQYPNEMWPLFTEFVDTVWIPQHSERYFKTRDPAALPHLPNMIPLSTPLPRLTAVRRSSAR